MFLKILFIQLCVLVFLSCKNRDKGKEQIQSIKYDSIGTNDSVPEFGRQKDTVILDSFGTITNRSKIEIATATKYFDSTSAYFDRSNEICSKWNLSKENIKKILLTSEDIDAGREFHDFYDVFPCSYKGTIIVDGKRAKYMINAGAFCRIEFKDTAFLMGYKKEDHKKYFLLGPGIE
jgi:hypothetical protein